MNDDFSNNSSKQVKFGILKALLIAVVAFVIGVIVLRNSILSIQRNREKEETYIETEAKVVEYKYGGEGKRAIVIEYKVNEKKYEKTSKKYSDVPESIGTIIYIKYNPEAPEDVIGLDDNGTEGVLVGAGFILFGVVVIILGIKSKNNKRM